MSKRKRDEEIEEEEYVLLDLVDYHQTQRLTKDSDRVLHDGSSLEMFVLSFERTLFYI